MIKTGFLLFVCIFFTLQTFAYNFTVSGIVVESKNGNPLPNQVISFFVNKNESPVTTKTDQEGNYSYTFTFKNKVGIPILVSTQSTCPNQYLKTVYSFAGKSKVNFSVCLPQENYICNADFEYLIGKDRSITLNALNIETLKDIKWSVNQSEIHLGSNAEHLFKKDGLYEICCTITTQYGCQSTVCKQIKINTSKKVGGNIYLKNTLMPQGTVYMYENNRASYANPQTTIATQGKYSYNEITSGNYIFYAIYDFEYDSFYYPKFIPTYTGSEIFWQKALNTALTENRNDINLYMVSYDEPYYGNGSISGKITTKIDIIGYSPSKIPILLLNEKLVPMDFTFADRVTGEFNFNFLPLQNYIIHPERAGMQTKDVKVILSETKPDFSSIDFEITKDSIVNRNTLLKKQEKNLMITFPNPVKDVLTVRFNNKDNAQSSMITIYDLQGKKVAQNIYTGNDVRFNTHNLGKGMYFIKATHQNGSLISFKRIIK